LEFKIHFARQNLPKVARCQGRIRSENTDFQVDEILGFEPQGEGEHVYLHIRKTGQNTVWVKEQLARKLGVKPQDIGHSGLKDRHAVTTQWLSIYSPVVEPDLSGLDIDGVEVLKNLRHPNKLRPGMHQFNRFRILVSEVINAGDTEHLMKQIGSHGFPNYFGEQRFGHDGNNLHVGWSLLQNRKLRQHKKKSIYLSALRSFLFNQVLTQRIETCSDESTAFDQTGPLWGRGRQNVVPEQKEFELQALKPWQSLYVALEFSGLNQKRRDLYQRPHELTWRWLDQDKLLLDFCLPPGSYATSLLHEIVNWYETNDRS